MPKPNQQKKPSKPGRPPLTKGSAKDGYLRVRVTADELSAIEVAARDKGQTMSEFIRGKLLATQGA